MEKMSLAARVRALAKSIRHIPYDGPTCSDDCPRCAAIIIAEHLDRMSAKAWDAHCDLAALADRKEGA